MQANNLTEQYEKTEKQKAAAAKLGRVDRNHIYKLAVDAFNNMQALLSSGKIYAIMRQIFEFTCYDVNKMDEDLTRDDLLRLEGRREVWTLIRENLLGNNVEAISKIEHHKQINRKNNNC